MSSRLVLDPIARAAHSLCADLLPERISLDEWGYPVIDDEPIGLHLLHHAWRAAATCPTLALALRRIPKPERPNP